MTIGIPRALIYWKMPYFWETFFENLGLKPVLSPLTNKEIVEQGVKVADPEICFATKVFFGHILWLEDRVDYVFVPRLKRNERGLEYCPRFFGLPDLIPLLIKTPMISPGIDLKKESIQTIAFKVGKKFCNDSGKIKKAIKISLDKVREEKEKLFKDYFRKIKSNNFPQPKKKILVISHPYNLYDHYVNSDIKKKLENLGTESIFVDEISLNSQMGTSNIKPVRGYKDKDKTQNFKTSNEVKFHWEFGEEIMQQVQEILKHRVSGAVEISSFQCGCDAVLKEFVEKEFKIRKIPFLYLMIDEHTADAGIQTRLEAFVDTI